VRPSVKGKRKLFFWMGIGLFVVMVLGFCLLSGSAAAQPPDPAIAAGGETIPVLWWLAPIGAIFGLIAAIFFYAGMKKESEGTKEMQFIAQGVREGAIAYLKRQYKIVAIVLVVLALIFAYLAFGLRIPIMNRWVPFAFLTGGFFSGLCGWLGMKTATYANARTANAARTSLDRALKVAFRSGAVMGLIVVGFGLLDICIWFLILSNVGDYSLTEITVTMLTFGMGASTQALFARVGGGIFTKAADVGSDLVGKVEAGIPEDDPRNPAVLADNVGDNVGDVAGMGADLYESYCGAILSAAVLGVSAGLGVLGIIVPMLIAGLGVIFSVIGVLMVRTKEGASQKSLLSALGMGVNTSAVLIAIASGFVVVFLLKDHLAGGTMEAVKIWLSIVIGLVVGIIIGKSTEYYTSYDYKPTKEIADQTATGPATVIIAGFSVGMQSTGIPVIATALGIFLSYWLAGGFIEPMRGLYGIAIAAVGMLSTLGITLATDAYGPIADNAAGNATMAGLEPVVRERTDKLDAIGNTTAATGKGFAIGSAALTALALIAAYIDELRAALVRIAENSADGLAKVTPTLSWNLEQARSSTLADYINAYQLTIMNPRVVVGLMIGAMIVYVFCAMINRAVGRNAGRMVEEVRRQWREIPGLMQGTAKADYARCVSISTAGAQKEMVVPSLMAIVVPVVVGLLLGPAGVMGLLLGGMSCGFITAIMLANSGGAWDNAKKYVESGAHGGKGSAAHKAAVVGDTVGDPFKDTSGPSLNILIKLMSMVSIVFVGVTLSVSLIFGKLFGF
jgi:K(+)-stimulated pyrophosphate-energized sodium pump